MKTKSIRMMNWLRVGVACMAVAWSEISMAGDIMNLSGTWQFTTDARDIGIKNNLAITKLSGNIHLPGSTDQAGIGQPGPERKGVLTRKHEYIGPAWYQKTVTIPQNWDGRDVELFLERVLWQSRVWVDGKEIGPPLDSWAAPHVHALGRLSPGKHTITLRIDNRPLYKLGEMAHSYGPQTQTVWNGIIGRIELRAIPRASIRSVRLFTSRVNTGWKLTAEVALNNKSNTADSLTAEIHNLKDGALIGQATSILNGNTNTPAKISVACKEVTPWSEFTPTLYRVRLILKAPDGKIVDTHAESFGFRTVAHNGNKLLLNGNPIFLRGNLDCVHFPLTGYPSTKKSDWLRIFKLYHKYNLNHVRFHSWCPPEAAFEAADEMGIYIQAEAGIWINEDARHGEGQGPGKDDPGVDPFAQAEMRRVVDTFGNHPSFILMAIGNELGHSNFDVTGQWIKTLKEYDPRRLYAASTARTITPYCDFNATHAVPGIGWVRQHMQPGTDWDYEKKYSKTTVPIIAHEIGQWPVYPDWSIINKFSGVLRNTRLEKMLEQAKAAGVYDQQKDFTKASGSLNALLYKDEIESFLRTPSCRGFQLLSMQDFQGQGEAYIGWLDMFWDSKGTTQPERFRGYCAPVVALARLPRYTYTANETLSARIVIRNDGPEALPRTSVSCDIRLPPGKSLVHQVLKTDRPIPKGAVATIGSFDVKLAELGSRDQARRFNLSLQLQNKAEPNLYPIWVYPPTLPQVDTPKVMLANSLDTQTLDALRNGTSVLLDAHALGDPDWQHLLAAWKPLYWSLVFFKSQNQTLGLLVRKTHPAFRFFPTDSFNNWQWWGICSGASGFDLTGIVPADYRPIAQPIPDFHANRKLGTIFEFKVGQGKLLVCGYNLSGARCKSDPAARQLRYSLMRYITSHEFTPRQTISEATLLKLFPHIETAAPAVPREFEKAALYVNCGGKFAANNQLTPYRATLDNVAIAKKGFGYSLKGANGIWKDQNCTAWIIRREQPAKLTLNIPKGNHGKLYIRFNDWNSNNRRGRIILEGGRQKIRICPHNAKKEGIWIALDILREDTLDGTVTADINCSSGPNLMLTDVVFVPAD